LKPAAVVPEQTVLRAHPQETGAVLKQAQHSQIAQPFCLSVIFKAVALREQRQRGQE